MAVQDNRCLCNPAQENQKKWGSGKFTSIEPTLLVSAHALKDAFPASNDWDCATPVEKVVLSPRSMYKQQHPGLDQDPALVGL